MSSSDEDHDEAEEMLCCHVCLLKYNNLDRLPKFLDCNYKLFIWYKELLYLNIICFCRSPLFLPALHQGKMASSWIWYTITYFLVLTGFLQRQKCAMPNVQAHNKPDWSWNRRFVQQQHRLAALEHFHGSSATKSRTGKKAARPSSETRVLYIGYIWCRTWIFIKLMAHYFPIGIRKTRCFPSNGVTSVLLWLFPLAIWNSTSWATTWRSSVRIWSCLRTGL